jgi:uncharacterized protein YbbC (DUF1343 family)
MIRTGLDGLLADPAVLGGRRYGLLAHAASVSADLVPIHLALASGPHPPTRLFGPEHGYYGVEQDMVASADERDPWTGVPIVSLYGDDVATLRPRPEAFAGLDLLVVDVQDVGARYYTYAATAIWSAEAALAAGCEVWVLDRPNPLGGVAVEGNLPRPGFESFVGAFHLPVRHGLTPGELFRLEARRRGWDGGLRVWPLAGWRREMLWRDIGRPWLAPSPNVPTSDTALVYPGLCLVEGTTLSEGRGTTRPFLLVGAPGVDPPAVGRELAARGLPGLAFVPAYFRPGFQKHGGELCGGVEIAVTDRRRVRPYRTGVELLAAFRAAAPAAFGWREKPYEFVGDRPAIDLLSGGEDCRAAIEAGDPSSWLATWADDEAAFREERRPALLYAEDGV